MGGRIQFKKIVEHNKNRNKMQRNIRKMRNWCVVLSLVLVGCEDSHLLGEGEKGNQHGLYEYRVESVVDGGEKGVIKKGRNLEGDIKNMKSYFDKDSRIVIYNYTQEDVLKEGDEYISYNVLGTELSSGEHVKRAVFDGEYKSPNAVRETDDIVAFYPGFFGNSDIYSSAREEIVEEEEETLEDGSVGVKVEIAYPTSREVFMDFSEQEGTIEALGRRFDVQIATARPEKVMSEGQRKSFKVSFPTLQRQIGIWGLQFRDAQGQRFAHIDSVEIMNVTAKCKMDMKTGDIDTWFCEAGTEQEDDNAVCRNYAGVGAITLHGKDNRGFSGEEMIYAALFPGEYKDVMFGVYAKDQTGKQSFYLRKYEGSVAKVKKNVAMSQVVEKCVDSGQIPYIKVAGVRWAPGNFVYCKYDEQEYWGIAPEQWWMSGLNMTPDFQQRKLSQFASHYQQRYSAYGQQDYKRPVAEEKRDQEVDLFQWGVIKGCETYNNSGYKWPEYKTYLQVGAGRLNGGSIQKSFYPQKLSHLGNHSQINSEEAPLRVDGSEVYGDPVWYYTNELKGNNNMGVYHKYHHYCMPSWEDVEALKTKAVNWPAYCYTNGGKDRFGNQLAPVRVYGWLFADAKPGEAGGGFSTKVGLQNWSMYIDATALVKTGNYLFIPITGIRLTGGMVRYRDMRSFAAARVMSASAKKNQPNMIDVFMFGPTQYTTLPVYKKQSFAIRPIYDPSVKDEDVPVEVNKVWGGFKENPR